MARVPTEDGPQVATAPLRPQYLRPSDTSNQFGAAKGRALQGVGQQISQAGGVLAKITTELQIQQNEFEVKKADVALSENIRILLDGDGTPENPGYRSLNGEEAVKALPTLNARITELKNNITQNIQGDRAKSLFSEYAAPKEQSAFGLAAAHSLQQGQVAQETVSLARIKNAELDAASPTANLDELAAAAAGESRSLTLKKTQDPETVAAAARNGATLVYKAGIDAAIDRRDPAEAERLLRLHGGKMDPGTVGKTQEAIQLAKDQQIARANQALSQAREERSLGLINEAIDLRLRAGNGEDVAQDALAFHQKYAEDKQGALQFLAIMNAGTAQQKRIAEEQAVLERGVAAIEGEVILDPYNSGDKKTADTTFEKLSAQWQQQNVPAAQQMEGAVTFVTQTGVIPEQVKQIVRGGLNSLNPETVLGAAGILDRVTAANPVFAQQFSPSQISLGVDVLDYVKSGATPDEAVRLARESRQVPEAQKTARSTEFTALVKENPPVDFLEAKYPGGWFSSAPATSSTMRAEFEKLAKQEYIKTGKLDSSYAAAGLILDRTWGVSAVSGTAAVMKHPPEKVYGQGNMSPIGNSTWMREQLLLDFTKDAAFPPGAEKSVVITPHPFARTPDGKMQYSVVFQNPETGELVTVMTDRGDPMAWNPDYSSSPEAARMKQKIADEQAGARMLREQQNAPAAVPDLTLFGGP